MKRTICSFLCVAVSALFTGQLIAQQSLTTPESIVQAIENNDLLPHEIIAAGDPIFENQTGSPISSEKRRYLRWRRDARPRSNFHGSTSSSTTADFYNYMSGMNQGLACTSGPAESVWRSLGPNPIDMFQYIGFVSSVAINPSNEQIIYAGTEQSGLWKSINGGDDWINITDDLNLINMGVGTISIDPSNPSNIVIGTNSGSFIYPDKGTLAGHGIFYSTDAGSTWTQSIVTGQPLTYWAAENIQRQPSNSDVLLCAGGKNVYKSTDGGHSWITVLTNAIQGNHNVMFKVEFSLDPTKTDDVFVSTRLRDPGSAQVFFSSSAGDVNTWTNATPTIAASTAITQVFELATSADEDQYVYAAYKEIHPNVPGQQTPTSYSHILKTNDGGLTWTNVNSFVSNTSLGSWRLEFEISDGDASVMYLGGNTLYKSTDDGATWAIVTQYWPTQNFPIAAAKAASTHGDIRSIVKIGYQNGEDKLLIGNDGGIAKSVNSASTWSNINGNGLAISQFCGLDAFWTRDLIIGGTIHNGLKKNNGLTWSQEDGSDYGYTLVDHEDEFENIYYTLDYAKLEKRFANGGTPQLVAEFKDDLGQKYTINPHNHHELIMGGIPEGGTEVVVLKINTEHQPFQSNILFPHISGDNTRAWPTVIRISPTNPDVIWIAFEGQTGGVPTNEFKLFKSTNGGTSWNNLTTQFATGNNTKLTIHSYVTDIAIHPFNENEVYFTMANYEKDPNDPTIGKQRVIRTRDAGTTFDDMSDGLPPVPVNSIQFYGTEQLYLGTDAGVFYNDLAVQPDSTLTKAFTPWLCFNNNFPNSVIAQLEIDPCGKKIYAGTMGRGAWETDLPDPQFSYAQKISANDTWNTPKKIYNKVVIEDGVTLNIIDTKIEFSEQGFIEVRPGGYLIVDDSELTTLSCANSWKGIYVAGVSNLPQYPNTHGKITLTGLTTISNAYNGIVNVGLDAQNEHNMDESGGIIDANSATFLNNRRDVQLLKYTNATTPYAATFDLCTFTRDGNYAFPAMFANITMWAVNQVKLKGCQFTNANTTQFPDGEGGYIRKRAIYTENASYKILERPVITNLIIKNVFTNYDRAIHSTFNICSQAILPIAIEDAEFNDNVRSIYLSGAEFARIVRNEINIRNNNQGLGNPIPNEGHYGIYFNQSYGFQLFGNILSTEIFNNSVPTSGIIFNNTASGYTEAYGNQIDGFKVGMAAYGKNQKDYEGLVFQCNEFGSSVAKNSSLGNRTDVFVKGLSGEHSPLEGVAPYQFGGTGPPPPPGTTTPTKLVAINHFSSNATNHIVNLAPWLINYYFDASDNARLEPTLNSGGVSTYPKNTGAGIISLSGCQTRNKKESDTFAQYLTDISQAESEIMNKNTTLYNLLNSENVAIIEAQILFASNQQDYQALYVNILDESPFVEEQVLLDVLELPNFPELGIRNIFVANPQASREEHIWQALEDRLPTLSQLTLDDIRLGQQTITARDILEMEISAAQSASEYASIRLIELYNTDETADHTTDITAHLKSRDEAYFRYALINHYYAQGDITNAQAERIDLPLECELSTGQLAEYNEMEIVYSIYENNINDLLELSGADLQTLQTMVDFDLGYRSEAMARSLISLNQGSVSYEEPIYYPGTTSAKKGESTVNRPEFPQLAFRLTPNPAQGGTTLNWNATELIDIQALEVHVLDMQGKEQMKFSISNLELEMKYIDISKLKSGAYILQVNNEKTILFHEKLIVQQ